MKALKLALLVCLCICAGCSNYSKQTTPTERVTLKLDYYPLPNGIPICRDRADAGEALKAATANMNGEPLYQDEWRQMRDSGQIIGSCPSGTTVSVVEKGGSAIHIRLDDGREGWVSNAFTAPLRVIDATPR